MLKNIITYDYTPPPPFIVVSSIPICWKIVIVPTANHVRIFAVAGITAIDGADRQCDATCCGILNRGDIAVQRTANGLGESRSSCSR